jgi:hypothetical protein
VPRLVIALPDIGVLGFINFPVTAFIGTLAGHPLRTQDAWPAGTIA